MLDVGGEREPPQDFGDGPEADARRWALEVDLAQRAARPWMERAGKIVKRYADERDDHERKGRRVAILWSIINTIAPAVYAQPPKPQVERRWRDADPAGRAAAQILERATTYALEVGQDFDGAARGAVMDYLTTGRGVLWARYQPTFRSVTPQQPVFPSPLQPGAFADMAGAPVDPAAVRFLPDGQPYIDGAPVEEIEREEVFVDHVHWSDFLHSPGRNWDEVRWVGRRSFLTRQELTERFGDQVGRAVKLDYTPSAVPESAQGAEHQAFKKAVVWEIWDKATKAAIWFAPGTPDRLLDRRADPLRLSGFFPCPPPLYATLSGDSLIPVPDYVYYQDDAAALDTLAQRIEALQAAVRAAGVYDAAQTGLSKLLEGGENKLYPVDSWAHFAQSGGFKGTVDFLPLGEMVSVLNQLYAAEKSIKDRIFEVTGISDIVRGQGMASETATAQRIKGRYAGMRLGFRQDAVARFLRDAVRIAAEIVAEHFAPPTLAQAAGVQFMGPDGAMFDQAVALLREDGPRGFRLDIETDSTIAADEQADKQAVTEFLGAVGQFIGQAMPAMQAAPQLGPMMGEMLKFGARRYRAGRALESAIEQGVDSLLQAAQQRQAPPTGAQPGGDGQPPPDLKAQAEAQKAMREMQERQQRLQADLIEQQARAQADIEIARRKAQADIEIAQLKASRQLQAEAMKAAAKTGVVYPMLQGYGDVTYG